MKTKSVIGLLPGLLKKLLFILAFVGSSPVYAQPYSEVEPNNPCGSAQDLSSAIIPVQVAGYKTQPNGNAVDFYKFSAAPGTKLRAELHGDTSQLNPLTSFGIGVFTSDCPAAPNSTAFTMSTAARLDFTVPANGTFIIGVTACCDTNFSGSGTIEGAYELSVRLSQLGSLTSEQDFGETSALAGKWWNWAMAGPPAENPLTDPDGRNCALRQRGTIWFLAGNFGGTLGEPNPVTRYCTIPAGVRILVPVYVALFWYPEDGATLKDIRTIANANVADPSLQLRMDLRVDGRLLADTFAYRAQSPPGGFQFNIPAGSITNVLFGYTTGPRRPAVADGYWALLNHLEAGSHRIRIRAWLGTTWKLDVTYELTVL